MEKKLQLVVGIFTCVILTVSDSGAQDFQLAKGTGGTSGDNVAAIVTDAGGNSYVTGYFYSSTIKFGTTTLTRAGSSTSYADIFVVKYDASGTVLWAKSSGGTGEEQGTGISLDANGNCYVTGFFNSATVVFGSTTLTTKGLKDVFITKYDPSGTVMWAKSVGGTGDDVANAISTDASGNSHITGSFRSPAIDFSGTVFTNVKVNDVFVAKYDVAGTLTWAKNAGGGHQDIGKSISTDGSGNVYVTGDFYSPSLVFGSTTLATTGTYDVFVVKYNSSGTVLWARQGGGSVADFANSIFADANGNAYVTGYFASSSVTFGTIDLSNITTVGTNDVFIVKYDASGTVLWANRAGGADGDVGKSIMADGQGNVYVTGLFYSATIAFGGTTLTNAGTTSYSDIFNVKYNSSGTAGWAKVVGSTGEDQGIGLGMDAGGNGYLAGHYTSSKISFGSASLSNVVLETATTTDKDVFIAKFYLSNPLTGMEENGFNQGTNIYPNPFTTSTVVTFDKELQNATAQIIDMLGKEVRTIDFAGNQLSIEKEDMQKGIYFIRIISDNKIITNKKVIVQ